MSTAVTIVLFALAAVAGALTRTHLIAALNRPGFPWGTLAVNLAGSLVAGLVAARTAGAARTVLATGALGSFTTFSTFAVEVRALRAATGVGPASAYALATAVGAVGLAVAGLAL